MNCLVLHVWTHEGVERIKHGVPLHPKDGQILPGREEVKTRDALRNYEHPFYFEVLRRSLMSQELPQEVTDKLKSSVDAIKAMELSELIALATEHGEEYAPEDVNEGWLKRKCAKLVKSAVLKEAGIDEAKTEDKKEDGEKPKKAGRKRMSTKGNFKIVLADGQSAGREGSTKCKLVILLKDEAQFNYEAFQIAVKTAMQYNAETETFGISTKFPSIGAATSAWFSELKNKQEIIQPIADETVKEASAE